MEILERLQELDWQMIQEVSRFDQERANEMVLHHGDAPRNWIKERFGV